MLAPFTGGHYCAHPMNGHDETQESSSLLATAFTKRITELSLSRREVVRRTGLSRQTLHNIEHESRVDLKPATLRALDEGLYWKPGTALALSQGDASVLQEADNLAIADKESAFRWRIVERIQQMSMTELERLVSMMEGAAFGETRTLTTDEVIARVEQSVMDRIDQRIRNLGTTERNGTST